MPVPELKGPIEAERNRSWREYLTPCTWLRGRTSGVVLSAGPYNKLTKASHLPEGLITPGLVASITLMRSEVLMSLVILMSSLL
jgi:hypothetical protein